VRAGLASGGALAAAFRAVATGAGFRQHKVGAP
jgi:hypothetical protein